MRNKKKYTNATFTKRVDHEAGRHRPARAISEPAVCEACGAVYANRRWTTATAESGSERSDHWRPPEITICPACEQQRSGEARGFVSLDGAFLVEHHEEIEQLLRNEAERAAEDNPLARIMEWKPRNGHQLTVSTTTEHLAQRLGHALEKAFGGKAHYDFSHENKLARVNWRRE
jgi:NMD protein affecting ribosome stability and mRNA decay